MVQGPSIQQPPEAAPSIKLLRASISHLREEYEAWQSLLDEQPMVIAHFLSAQAASLAGAIVQQKQHAQFTLPNEVVVDIRSSGRGEIGYIPGNMREHQIGGLIERIAHGSIGAAISQRLTELEQSPEQGVAMAAGLLRHATVMHMVYNVLPSGRSVTYEPDEGEEIPSIPVDNDWKRHSAFTASTDAIVEEKDLDRTLDELLVPFVPFARCFYLPQWVAFDDKGRLLVNSVIDAEAHLSSMQRFLRILHAALALAPYVVADRTFQAKRYGMLGQLVNQGRALARYETRTAIREIQQRAGANNLNRGLSLSLPYFDDQALVMKLHCFEVIPAGRIMFIPAFVVRAAEAEQAKVAQDTRLNPSTRKHLLIELKELAAAFQTA
jgi:hypothetical protein